MYEREVLEQQEKVEKMQQEGRDEADIRKQVNYLSHSPLLASENDVHSNQGEILDESRAMIPDSQARFQQAKATLQEQIVRDPSLSGTM